MKQWFMLVSLGVLMLSLIGCQPALPVEAQAPPELADLHRQIQLLNLINGLELTPDQMRFILERAQEAQELREASRDEADVDEVDAVLEQIRDTLMAEENLSDELKARFFEAKAENKQLVENYKAEALRLAQEIEESLEDHQLYALEHYAPCVIPPEGESRIGQARDAKGGAALERLRALSAEQFEAHKEEIAGQVLRRLQARFHRRILILDREEELHRILDLMEETRRLSDVDFELQKEELVEELLAPYEATRPPAKPTAVIARYLLDPAIIPLLEEKLALVEE